MKYAITPGGDNTSELIVIKISVKPSFQRQFADIALAANLMHKTGRETEGDVRDCLLEHRIEKILCTSMTESPLNFLIYAVRADEVNTRL